jgi:hypothetical protein
MNILLVKTKNRRGQSAVQRADLELNSRHAAGGNLEDILTLPPTVQPLRTFRSFPDADARKEEP